MTKTEQLEGQIIDIVFTFRNTNVAHELAGQILTACKEAGLKFVGKELTLPPIKNLNAQIEEIEI